MRGATPAQSRPLDIIVWGSTGFTGKLVCQYLQKNYATNLKWGIAGRSSAKLIALKKELGLAENVEVIEADLRNKSSLELMVGRSRVLLTTAGPYAKIGTPIVDACVACSTHYCDLTGEPQWVREMVDRYHTEAASKKVKIVNCCGYDCIPSDLGTKMIVDAIQGAPGGYSPEEVRLICHEAKGGASGGTIASVMNVLETSSASTMKLLMNPFCLNPRNEQTSEPAAPPPPPGDADGKSRLWRASDNMLMGFDPVTKQWTSPYFMQGIDTRIINRSNALTGFRYGSRFLFTERMHTPGGFLGAFFTSNVVMPMVGLALVVPFFRYFLKMVLPKPGQGPDADMLKTGFFKMRLWGRGINEETGETKIFTGGINAMNGDPGYAQTSKMISEAAICLLGTHADSACTAKSAAGADAGKGGDIAPLPETYGVLTPSVAMGDALKNRLQEKGIEFYVNN